MPLLSPQLWQPRFDVGPSKQRADLPGIIALHICARGRRDNYQHLISLYLPPCMATATSNLGCLVPCLVCALAGSCLPLDNPSVRWLFARHLQNVFQLFVADGPCQGAPLLVDVLQVQTVDIADKTRGPYLTCCSLLSDLQIAGCCCKRSGWSSCLIRCRSPLPVYPQPQRTANARLWRLALQRCCRTRRRRRQRQTTSTHPTHLLISSINSKEQQAEWLPAFPLALSSTTRLPQLRACQLQGLPPHLQRRLSTH